VLLVGGMRVVSKKTLVARSVVTETVTGGKAA